MTKKDVHNALKTIMTDSLLQMSALTGSGATENTDFLSAIKIFLISIISTAADITETIAEGGATWIYSEIETAAKQSNFKFIQNKTMSKNQYSISDIDPNDFSSAMNYIGQALSTTLFKTIHELPQPLRKPEMLLRGVECLLSNLLHQKFSEHDVHKILDNLCEHVHMSLNDLDARDNSAKTKSSLKLVES